MAGINSIFNTGNQALFVNQTALQVTGNNIANVNTEGYSRQSLIIEDGMYLDGNPGQIGIGVTGKEIVRYFDNFIESQYVEKSTQEERYNVLYQNLQSMESLFNENSTSGGLSDSLNAFFNDWQNLTTAPEDYSTRQTTINDTLSLVNVFQQTSGSISSTQEQIDEQISQGVDEVNQLLSEIADLNRQIAAHDAPGQNNANGIKDTRNTKLRALAKLIDIRTIDNGMGNLKVLTNNGATLVDGTNTFDLKFEAGKTIKATVPGSSFNGQCYYEGQDDFEYTIKVVTGGDFSGSSTGATFQVSLDGGHTWVTSSSGRTAIFSARDEDAKVSVGNLNIYFGRLSNSSISPTGSLTAGDTFTLVPKKSIYWYESASTPLNMTPQKYLSGEDDTTRMIGGALCGLCSFRDYYAGRYKERLNNLANNLIWEVNRQHSQGAGLEKFTDTTGSYAVTHDDIALGSKSSGLAFGTRLTSGASMMYFYNSSTGALASGSSFGMIDFSSVTAGLQTFDPNTHTISNVAAAINATFGTFVTASVINHSLRITANAGYSYSFGADSSGLYAALGLNTYFNGSKASDISVNATVNANSNFINTGHANGAGEANPGDNTTALNIVALQNKKIAQSSLIEGTTTQSIGSYYESLVATVGSDTANANYTYQFQSALAADLKSRQDAVAGVNLDEEMASLIKFQHSYQAAAKLITTADQMLQTVLGLKQ